MRIEIRLKKYTSTQWKLYRFANRLLGIDIFHIVLLFFFLFFFLLFFRSNIFNFLTQEIIMQRNESYRTTYMIYLKNQLYCFSRKYHKALTASISTFFCPRRIDWNLSIYSENGSSIRFYPGIKIIGIFLTNVGPDNQGFRGFEWMRATIID